MPRAAPPGTRPRAYQKGPHLWHRGSVWWIRDGRSAWTTGERDRLAAERVLGEYLAGRRDRGAAREAPREATLVSIVDAYLSAPWGWRPRTKASCAQRTLQWLVWCSGRGIALPSQTRGEDAQGWIAEQLAGGKKHATINRSLVIVRRMMRWASHPDRGFCVASPWERLEQLREDRRAAAPIIPSPREVSAVITWLDAHGHERPPVRRGRSAQVGPRRRVDRAHDPRPEARLGVLYVALSLATGARISEIAGLTVEQLHPGCWIVPPSKGHAERRVPLPGPTERAARELAGLLGTAKARNGKKVAITEHWALELLAHGCAGAGVEAFQPHDLRRTFATECRRADLAVTVIRDLMGHKDTQTTERYFGSYREDMHVVVPVPSALHALMQDGDAPAKVVPLRR